MASTRPTQWFNVTEYGVDLKNSKTHVTGIQAAIDAAAEVGGGVVIFPPGEYSLEGSASTVYCLHIKSGDITLRGSGPLTEIKIPVSEVGRTPVYVTGGSPHILDLSFSHEQPNPGPGWKPNPYKAVVTIEGTSNAIIQNLYFLNATIGIIAKSVGNTTIKDIRGQILGSGITIQDPTGKVDISNITFSPEWSKDPIVLDYQKANVVAIRGTSVAVSGSQLNCTNINAFNCGHGFIFDGRAPGFSGSTPIFITDCVNGPCGIGIRTLSPGIRITINTYTYVGRAVEGADGMIRVDNDTPSGPGEGACSIIADNLTSFGSERSAITILGPALLLISGTWLQDWAQGNGASLIPAIFLSSAEASCVLHDVKFFQQPGSPGGGAPETGGKGKFVFV